MSGNISMFEKLEEFVRNIELAEKMAPNGSREQEQYVKAALYSAWPSIRVIVKIEQTKQK